MADKKIDNEIPADLASKWERMTEIAAQRLFDKRKQLQARIGPRPYRGLPVSKAEQLVRYSQVRRDPRALVEILRDNAITRPDGRVLVPKDLLAAMREMEVKLRKGDVE